MTDPTQIPPAAEAPLANARPRSKADNPLLSLLVNIILPALIMDKTSGADALGPINSILVALAFPIGWSVFEFQQSKKVGFIPILGFLNVFLTGGLAVMQAELIWFAVKEAAMPGMLGLAVLGSQYTSKPLVRTFMLNETVVNVPKLTAALRQHQREGEFNQLMAQTSWLLALSFFLSSALNFGLARYVLTQPPGTEAFAKELSRMTLLSYPVIVLPTMVITIFALFKMIRGIKKLTGLTMEEVFHAGASGQEAESSS